MALMEGRARNLPMGGIDKFLNCLWWNLWQHRTFEQIG